MKITDEAMANLADMVMNREKPTHLGEETYRRFKNTLVYLENINTALEKLREELVDDEGSDGTRYRCDDGVKVDRVYHYMEAAGDLVYTANKDLEDILRRADK